MKWIINIGYTIEVVNLEKKQDLVVLIDKLFQSLSEFHDGNRVGSILIEQSESSLGKERLYDLHFKSQLIANSQSNNKSVL